ncbi:MAG: hypothetical protein HUJ54_10070 [Erysipelotrichaceae bacterium]|nr:hypothetical protein [Erysipelotrichaceae bacterium]
MDAIKQYINRQFQHFPNTKEAEAAREHLIELAEDKYKELIDSGANEFEAFAEAILSAGSREEIRQLIFMEAEVQGLEAENRLDSAAAKNILRTGMLSSALCGLSTACLISSVIWPLVLTGRKSMLLMVATFAAGWGLAMIQKSVRKCSAPLKAGKNGLNPEAEKTVRQAWNRAKPFVLTMKVMGGISVVCSILPIVFGKNGITIGALIALDALGVFLFMTAYGMEQTFRKLLDEKMKLEKSRLDQGKVSFDNSTITAVMKVYWPVVAVAAVCISLFTSQFWLSGILILTALLFKIMINDTAGKKA